jgi:RHH-type transcriptional regulator, proline utilization regulon repressor / proline dehydrogenase / delta 1-pyrroline-5-carboxylate dehydrogenase
VSIQVRKGGEAATPPPFANEPVLELRRADARDALAAALAELDPTLPLEVPVVIGGDRRFGDAIPSTDPGHPERVVAIAAEASADEVNEAVSVAAAAAEDWGRRPAGERAAALVAAAGLLRERRLELAALEVRECAKPWGEADADVCEAIDFLEYYARGALELESGRELLQAPGERNSMRYAPRGVAAVISPWNFPLAIPTGMTAAALACGNAVVLKPAEQSPGCALRLVEALHESGVPANALALLPGYGEAGASLVRHPGVHVIAFTGSSAVGREIIRVAAETPDGQAHVKRVVAEMGGKNCVIVDADADLDEAVPEVVRSAFAYAGQKCSACARVLVHEALAGDLVRRLAGAVEVLAVDQAERFGADVPPVIEREAQERVRRYAALAEREGEIAATGGSAPADGWFCEPILAASLPPDSDVLRDEIFGPLLAVEEVASVEAACDRVEALPFALTGGLFSRDPAVIAAVTRRLPVGNLYVNRHITGAMVGRQPFGGNKLSGIGSKAGGPDYLLQFVEPRVVSENTMRHGLVME